MVWVYGLCVWVCWSCGCMGTVVVWVVCGGFVVGVWMVWVYSFGGMGVLVVQVLCAWVYGSMCCVGAWVVCMYVCVCGWVGVVGGCCG